MSAVLPEPAVRFVLPRSAEATAPPDDGACHRAVIETALSDVEPADGPVTRPAPGSESSFSVWVDTVPAPAPFSGVTDTA